MAERFTTVIKKHEGIDGAYVDLPFDVEETFGAKRVKIRATFDGVPYRGSIVRMGGTYFLGMTQAIRKAVGKDPGDTVEVTVEKDEEERRVEPVPAFRAALQVQPAALAFFESLSYSRQKDYNDWIGEAKREETRTARIEKAVALLKEGRRLK